MCICAFPFCTEPVNEGRTINSTQLSHHSHRQQQQGRQKLSAGTRCEILSTFPLFYTPNNHQGFHYPGPLLLMVARLLVCQYLINYTHSKLSACVRVGNSRRGIRYLLWKCLFRTPTCRVPEHPWRDLIKDRCEYIPPKFNNSATNESINRRWWCSQSCSPPPSHYIIQQSQTTNQPAIHRPDRRRSSAAKLPSIIILFRPSRRSMSHIQLQFQTLLPPLPVYNPLYTCRIILNIPHAILQPST